jgi:hypothetical protein
MFGPLLDVLSAAMVGRRWDEAVEEDGGRGRGRGGFREEKQQSSPVRPHDTRNTSDGCVYAYVCTLQVSTAAGQQRGTSSLRQASLVAASGACPQPPHSVIGRDGSAPSDCDHSCRLHFLSSTSALMLQHQTNVLARALLQHTISLPASAS